MLLQLISDLHSEFRHGNEMALMKSLPLANNLDFLVVAGDLASFGAQGDFIIKAMFEFLSEAARHVLYVTGNHEYYGKCTKAYAENRLKAIIAAYPNVHWLNNEELTLDGVHFVGGTMWYPSGDGLNQFYKRLISDSYQIAGFDWAERENAIFDSVVNSKARPETIVITHHMPHPWCTPPMWKDSPTNRFFVSNQAHTMLQNKPKLWLFGHTHTPCRHQFMDTLMVCNPLGYPMENKGPYAQVIFDV